MRLSGEALITLFQLDLTTVGGPGTIHFTKDSQGVALVAFRGQDYQQVDVEANGFEWAGSGPMPRPTIRVSNVAGLLTTYLLDYNDLIGCKLTRIRTFARFLDGHEDSAEAPYAYIADVFVVEQKVQQNATAIEWRLSSALDQQGRMLPNRQIVRDNCMFRYRTWDAALGRFDNGDPTDARAPLVTCPYADANYFDRHDNTVATAAQDQCSKKVSGCKVRFGQYGSLPFGGFPAVARTR